jgi:pSer/pThr/pTyr-binding forkhead associated (FHA) protein
VRESVEPEQGVVPGRLFGWLVNYSDPNGSAIELREGKFFVSRESLKSSDMIVDDPSVSTPHAMLKVGGTQGFFVQDLMSENGVFIRHKGTDVYQQESEGCKLSHGDWVRFGNVEYLVSLIAHIGEQ